MNLNIAGSDNELSILFPVLFSTMLAITLWMMTKVFVESDLGEVDDTFDCPPDKLPTAASYCSDCKAQYRPGFTQCNTCDVRLITYKSGSVEE